MATIIKGRDQARPTERTVRGVAYNFSDLSGQADAYLDTVRSEAAKIIQQAKEESARIAQQAEVAGRQAAEKAIERILDEKVAKQMATLTPALRSAVAQIEEAQVTWSGHWEKSLVQLAASIAERIVRREIKSHPEIPQQWIAESLQMVAGSAKVTLRLNPGNACRPRKSLDKNVWQYGNRPDFARRIDQPWWLYCRNRIWLDRSTD